MTGATTSETPKWVYAIGLIPTIWVAILIAPSVNGGLPQIIKDFPQLIESPFNLSWCNDSLKVILIFILGYIMGISIYLSTRKNYRRKEEHGSAKWGVASVINKKYMQKPISNNKLLTQNVVLGLNGKQHRRNLNILVCGGSGAGKTRFYCKPNIMQCNTSFVILDPKGEIVRDLGYLLEEQGYEVKVLDLINMDRSFCYNPFVYLKSDNDVQKLVTNLFKATTPKGSSSNDPFWDTAASMLLLALIFYLKYEAPEEEQNVYYRGWKKVLNSFGSKRGMLEITTFDINESENILDFLVNHGIVASRREGREFLANGSITLNGNKIIDLEYIVSKEHVIEQKYIIVRRGKKKYYLFKYN